MKRETLKTLIYLFLLMVVAPLGIKAYYERWWIRDPEKLCRMALYELNAKQYSRSKVLWRRAAKLRTDWFVPYAGFLECEAQRSAQSDWLDWLCGYLPEPLDWPFLRWDDKRSSSETRRNERILRQACRLVEDPDILFGVWKKDPEAAEFFARGYHEWKAKRYDASAWFFDQGISRYPSYIRTYVMLFQSCARGGHPEWASGRFTYLSPNGLNRVCDDLAVDESLLATWRRYRPPGWNLRFSTYYKTDRGWSSKPAKSVYVDSIVAAHSGVLWTFGIGGTTGCREVWRLQENRWKRFSLKSAPIGLTLDDQGFPWVMVHPMTSSCLPVRVFRGGQFMPLVDWQFRVIIYGILFWNDEVWLDTKVGPLRHARGKWWLYLRPGDTVSGRIVRTGRWTVPVPGCVTVVPQGGHPRRTDEPGTRLCRDRNGRLWLGGRVFVGETFSEARGPISHWRQYSVSGLGGGTLWGAGEGPWRTEKWVTLDDGNSPFYASVLGTIDHRRRLWFVRYNTLFAWDGTHLMFWNKDDGIGGEGIHSLALDGNTLWIGTDRGGSRTTIPN